MVGMVTMPRPDSTWGRTVSLALDGAARPQRAVRRAGPRRRRPAAAGLGSATTERLPAAARLPPAWLVSTARLSAAARVPATDRIPAAWLSAGRAVPAGTTAGVPAARAPTGRGRAVPRRAGRAAGDPGRGRHVVPLRPHRLRRWRDRRADRHGDRRRGGRPRRAALEDRRAGPAAGVVRRGVVDRPLGRVPGRAVAGQPGPGDGTVPGRPRCPVPLGRPRRHRHRDRRPDPGGAAVRPVPEPPEELHSPDAEADGGVPRGWLRGHRHLDGRRGAVLRRAVLPRPALQGAGPAVHADDDRAVGPPDDRSRRRGGRRRAAVRASATASWSSSPGWRCSG